MSRNPELTRQLIIDKALPIFNTKGYAAASISDITAATGITKGAIYGNFKNKDEVAVAAFEYAMERILEKLRASIKQAGNAPDKLRAIVNYYQEYVLNPPVKGGCPVLNTSVEADDNHPLLRTKVVRFIGLVKDSLKQIIYRGVAEQQLKADIDVEGFATFMFATIEGAIMLSRVEGDGFSYTHVKRHLDVLITEISC